MAFKIKSTEVITNNSEIKGKRSAGRLGKVIVPTSGAFHRGLDITTGNYFVIDYNEIVNDSDYIASGASNISLYVASGTSVLRSDTNQVPGDRENPYNLSHGISDGFEFTLLIKNIWGDWDKQHDFYGSYSTWNYNVERPSQSATFADVNRIGISNGDANFAGDLKTKYGSDIIFKVMKPANKFPGGGSSIIGGWDLRWVAFPMMRNLF